MQLPVSPGPKLPGLHVIPGEKLRRHEADGDRPGTRPGVAVTVALWLLARLAAAVALKIPASVPAGIVMDAGTVSAGLLLASAPVAPPVGAGRVKVTVHVLIAPGPRLAARQTANWISGVPGRVGITTAPPLVGPVVVIPG